MEQSGKKSANRFTIPTVLGLVGAFFMYYFFINGNNMGTSSSVSSNTHSLESIEVPKTESTPIRKEGVLSRDSVNKEEILKKNEQKFHGLKKYTTFNTANTKPFFKVGPGSVKKLSTEKPEQSNPFITGVEPSSSDRLPTITVDDESDPAIFFSSQNPNDCESQSPIDTLPEIDLLTGKLMISPLSADDSTKSIKP
jgi:hypothetical protein